MISRINSIRRKLVFLILIVLLAAQSLTILPDISLSSVFFFLVANILALTMIYGFRGFETSTLTRYIYTFYSFVCGSLIAFLPITAVVLIFKPGFPALTYLVSVLLLLFILPFICTRIFRAIVPKLPARRCLVIGREAESSQILKEISEHLLGHLEVMGYINPSPVTLEERVMSAERPDSIVIADPVLAKKVESSLDLAMERDISIDYLPTLAEDTLRRIPIQLLKQFPEYYTVAFSKARLTLSKRFLDMLIALAGLLFTLPLTLFFIIAIPLSSGFPVIFTQERIGRGMKPFLFFKFRSLRNLQPEDKAVGEDPNSTIKRRITGFGQFMRKLRLDELPQFINVLLNDMSVIGPRPEMEEYHSLCIKNIPWYDRRYLLKPGITGWAQINYKHTSSVEDYIRKTEYDLYYVKNRSLRLDLEIALKTLQTMIGMRGSV